MTFTLKVENISKTYGEIKAVQDISFKTQIGEIIAILGPNGAGKSTLMNMISGFIAPTSGKIFVLEQDISSNAIEGKKNIGFLPEGSPLYPDLTVKEFLNYMAELRGLSRTAKKERLEEIIETAKIKEVYNQKIETLSKGYLRRVGFAQSIISDPEILLLDEPTDGLDPNQKEHMRSLIKQLGQNKTILISTHLLDEAENIAGRIILLNQGKIITDGTLKDILFKADSSDLDTAFKKLTLGVSA